MATLHYCAFSSRDYMCNLWLARRACWMSGNHRVLNHVHYTENPGWKDKTAQIAGAGRALNLNGLLAHPCCNAAASGAGIAVMPSYAAPAR